MMNQQIIDAVTQASLQVLGTATTLSMAQASQLVNQASGLAAQNAVNAQQHSVIMNQATSALSAQRLLTANKQLSAPVAMGLGEALLMIYMVEKLTY